MRIRFREVKEVKEDKGEKNLPIFPDDATISLEEADAFWDDFFSRVIPEEKDDD